jgi:hypothetical protein
MTTLVKVATADRDNASWCDRTGQIRDVCALRADDALRQFAM